MAFHKKVLIHVRIILLEKKEDLDWKHDGTLICKNLEKETKKSAAKNYNFKDFDSLDSGMRQTLQLSLPKQYLNFLDSFGIVSKVYEIFLVVFGKIIFS